MLLVGKFVVNGTEMFLCRKELKGKTFYALLSQVHREDLYKSITGEKTDHTVIKSIDALKRNYSEGYVLEAIKTLKTSGRNSSYGKPNILLRVMDALAYARGYSFSGNNILEDSEEIEMGSIVKSFNAVDENVQYSYESRDGELRYLRVKTSNITFELHQVGFNINFDKLDYVEMQQVVSRRVQLASLKDISFDILNEMLDMSWYRKDGIDQKQYRSIETRRDFELEIMTGLAKEILRCQKEGKTVDVAVDTETSGLMVYNLAADNPIKDHCVAVPICWEDNKSYVIFTDMEFFSNVSNEYVADRLATLFEMFKGERTLEYYDYEEDSGRMTAFGDDGNGERKLIKKSLTFKRSDVNLIGHNSPFDGRVFFDLGKKFYFNNDTQQMAFNLNPATVRGSKKLKVLTRILFKHETPELDDVLGRGNEDKYRYLRDKEVAEIYGCADADYTRKVYYELRDMMSDSMYRYYQKQDVPMLNILYQSDYWGMKCIGADVQELARKCQENIKILEEAVFSYVGSYVQYTNSLNTIKLAYESGKISEEECQEAIRSVEIDNDARYEFDFTDAQLRHILYDVMKYPVKAYTEGKKRLPKVDKVARKRLLRENLKPGESPIKKLQHDILASGVDAEQVRKIKEKNPGDKRLDHWILIDANKFNKKKYPLAMIIQKHAELKKEYTGYYKPIVENNLEEKLFYGYNMARIETRRIANAGQTMKGDLKALVCPYEDDEYLLDFDMSQVEYRIMISIAKFMELVNKMKNPENDFHTETASMMNHKPAYKVTKKERKGAKKASFGIPYGIGVRDICEDLFDGVVNDETLFETRMLLETWKKKNKPVIDMLEAARAEAFVEWKIPDKFRNFIDAWRKDENGEYLLDEEGNKIPAPISKVENMLGFYRIFKLDNIDLTENGYKRRASGEYTAEEGSIRRKAGNYPIQSTAAEFFRLILIRFYEECEKYGIQDKVKWYMLIHDELLCSVKNDVHPFLLYKIVKKACMITMKNHTKYFIGIGIGKSWAECKSDEKEAPIFFVERMIKRFDDGEFREIKNFTDPWRELIQPLMDTYKLDRIGEVITELQPQFPENPLDLNKLLVQFTNYTVRAYVYDFPKNGKIDFVPRAGSSEDAEKLDNLGWIKCLESWALAKYDKPVKFLDLDGEEYVVRKAQSEEVEEDEDDFDDFVDFDELFDKDGNDDVWEIDEASGQLVFMSESIDESESDFYEEELEFDFSKKANDVTAMTVIKEKYHNLKLINKQIVINVLNRKEIKQIQKILQPDVSDGNGLRVVFQGPGIFERWLKVSDSINLEELDGVLGALKEEGETMQVVNETLLISLENRKQLNILSRNLGKYSGSDYRVFYRLGDSDFSFLCSFSKVVSLEKLKGMIDKITGGN